MNHFGTSKLSLIRDIVQNHFMSDDNISAKEKLQANRIYDNNKLGEKREIVAPKIVKFEFKFSAKENSK